MKKVVIKSAIGFMQLSLLLLVFGIWRELFQKGSGVFIVAVTGVLSVLCFAIVGLLQIVKREELHS